MSGDTLDTFTDKLSNAKMSGDGVSFGGQSLKLNNANDAKVVVDEIEGCKSLEFLDLEGNTLGVEAAKAIGVALGSRPELKRALWKDMFTGRLKNEIPQALRYLGSGLDVAGVRLVELDLSDNAFGPIGMEGLASLLRSTSCYSLQILRLNNNGLGITGAKLLSKALLDCYEFSKGIGKPLPLRVFIAGRNRLENEGITALSRVFKILGTLEEIQIPQNGIYYQGISHLANALTKNTGLRILNLNDNTVGPKGSESLATALNHLQQLRTLNLGDCLLKTSGALKLASSLQPAHLLLEEIILDHNEMKRESAYVILETVRNKTKLSKLSLDGNQFGEEVIEHIKAELKSMSKESTLGSFSEDEGEDDEDEEDENDEDEDEEGENEEEYDENIEYSEHPEEVREPFEDRDDDLVSVESKMLELLNQVTAADFLQFPTPERFLALESRQTEQILDEVKKGAADVHIERLVSALMKVSSLVMEWSVSNIAMSCALNLYRELFKCAETRNQVPLVHNTLLVHLGLIKAEDKKTYPEYNKVACRTVLEEALKLNFFPQGSQDTLKFFLK